MGKFKVVTIGPFLGLCPGSVNPNFRNGDTNAGDFSALKLIVPFSACSVWTQLTAISGINLYNSSLALVVS